jgi:outer membrane receptor for Fe3+-dicitrate
VPSLVDERSLGQIPEHRLTFGTVIAPLQRLGENFEGFEVGLHGVFTGKQHPTSFESTPEATFAATGGAGYTIKSYSVWDFIVSYKWRNQKIYFKINNLFDNKYYSRSINATSFGGGLAPAGTFNFVNPGAPREYIVGTTWEFGD